MFYWRERNREVDFVGGDGIPVEELLLEPVEHKVKTSRV